MSVAPRALYAQEQQAPAHVATVDGTATLERESGVEPATAGGPFVPGDRLITTTGRVEILFPDGTSLAIDEYSTVDLQSDTLIRLVEGRVLLQVARTSNPEQAVHYQIDTPVATALNAGPGEYRVTVLNGRTGLETELAVLRGAASLATEQGSMLVRAGERSLAADNTSPVGPQSFNSARFDAFDRWASARRSARLGPALSAQYLPSDLRTYSSTFDRDGDWAYEPSYGYVWYPTVATGWRPYYNGYWRSIPRYGWTWIGLDTWGWPTHHYGRWGHGRDRWFWIPDRHWGTAWVSWASAPGYVSWGPLGFDNRPVFALSVRGGDPWRGWAVLPRSHFGVHTTYVNYYSVAARRAPAPGTFVVQNAAPATPARAVPRVTRAADVGRPATGGTAVPRGRSFAAPTQPALPETAEDAARRSGTPAGGRASTNSYRAVPRDAEAPPPAFKQPLPTQTRVPRAVAEGGTPNGTAAPRAMPRTSPGWPAPHTPTSTYPAPGARNRSSAPAPVPYSADAAESAPAPRTTESPMTAPRGGGAVSSGAMPRTGVSARTPSASSAPARSGSGTRAVPREAPAPQAAPPASSSRGEGQARSSSPPAGARQRSR